MLNAECYFGALLAVAAGAAVRGADSPRFVPATPAGYEPLLAEKELRSWTAEGSPKGRWSFRDGILACEGEGEDLWTHEGFGDFALRAAVKFPPDGRAAILLRGDGARRVEIPPRPPAPAGAGPSGDRDGEKGISKPPARPGGWSTVSIVLRGRRLSVEVDGEVLPAADIPDLPEEGPIGIAGGRSIEVAGLGILRLPRSPAAIFDGSSLAGWKAEGSSPLAHGVRDGSIVLRKEPRGWLHTEEERTTCFIEGSWRAAGDEPPGGRIVLRVLPADRVLSPPGSQPGRVQEGLIARFVRTVPSSAELRGETRKPLPGAWSTFWIFVRKDGVEVFQDGEKTFTSSGMPARRGPFGFQSPDAEVEVRDLRLQDL
jgi:hypothetical protein